MWRFCDNEAAAVPQPRLSLCSCLFQILFQWELSPVVRWAPPFCCLCSCWHSPSSSTANAKAVSAHSRSLMCVCVCVGARTHTYCMCLSVFLSSTLYLSSCRSTKKGTYASRIAFYSNEINEYSYYKTNCLKTPTVHFRFHSADMDLCDYVLNKLGLLFFLTCCSCSR